MHMWRCVRTIILKACDMAGSYRSRSHAQAFVYVRSPFGLHAHTHTHTRTHVHTNTQSAHTLGLYEFSCLFPFFSFLSFFLALAPETDFWCPLCTCFSIIAVLCVAYYLPHAGGGSPGLRNLLLRNGDDDCEGQHSLSLSLSPIPVSSAAPRRKAARGPNIRVPELNPVAVGHG